MWGAAPPRPVRVALLLAAIAATVAAAPASARSADDRAARLPELWAVGANSSFTPKSFARLRRAGVNTVLLDTDQLTKRQVSRLSRRARRAHLRVLVPLSARGLTAAGVGAVCDRFRQTHSGALCTVRAPSYGGAVALATAGGADLVVAPIASPNEVMHLSQPQSGRVLVYVRVPRRFQKPTWRRAIRSASHSARIDLAVAPRTARDRSYTKFLTSLQASGATRRDRKAPTTPGAFTVRQQGQTSISTSWSPSVDNVAVAGYELYVDGKRVTTLTPTAYTAIGFACGTSHSFDVDAFDAAGNRSRKASLVAQTAGCALDVLPPSAPGNLAVTKALSGSLSVSWTASVDNVAVAGYGVYVNGSLVGTTQGTSFAVTGLSCGVL